MPSPLNSLPSRRHALSRVTLHCFILRARNTYNRTSRVTSRDTPSQFVHFGVGNSTSRPLQETRKTRTVLNSAYLREMPEGVGC